jgi:asparagine synthase (glutamine-hydrolysing)
MCGICGTAGFADKALLERMNAVMAHRGPDDEGIYLSPDGSVGLGNRRLSIIDLSQAGHQPMTNESGTVWITYNGEVYNFQDLRAGLLRAGHQFRSNTDTEVIVHLYEDMGVDCLRRLNGMFGVAIWDEPKHRLLLARDPLGIKPVYYTQSGAQLLFASEVKCLLQSALVRVEPDLEALHYFLCFLWVPGPKTLFKGIRKLMPGEMLVWEDGHIQVERYWDMDMHSVSDRSEKALTVELKTLLTQSVARHLISDVPVGVFLSGGLDSSSILALASQITHGPVKAYTIAYGTEDARLEQSGDDRYYAQQVARHFDAEYHEIEVQADVSALLPKVVWHLDEPVADPAAITSLLICRAARPDVTVLLSGQGADEIFAGYRVHRNDQLARRLSLLPRSLRDRVIMPGLQVIPRIKGHLPATLPGLALAVHRYLDKLLRGVDLPPEQRYVFYRSYYTQAELLSLYTAEMREAVKGLDPAQTHLAYFGSTQGMDFLNRTLYVDAKTFLTELNLTYSDKMSMAESVEVRVPFLDREVVEFMAQVRPNLKINGLTTKYLLRKAMQGIVPSKVIRRRKAGFGAPIRKWLKSDLRTMIGQLLSESRLRMRGILEPAAVQTLLDENVAGIHDHTYPIWALLSLEVWMQTFVDREQPSEPVRR